MTTSKAQPAVPSPKTIDTLIPDVQSLFSERVHESNPENVKTLGQQIAETVAKRLSEDRSTQTPTLRMSNLGKGDRQIWYEVKSQVKTDPLPADTKMKFLFGDVWESIMLFLAKEAGHEVTHEQEEVEIGGVLGHTDAVIDGVLVDVKTASKFAFKKFKEGTLQENDAFGYYDQLAGYSTALGGLDGAWWAVEKEQGHMTLLKAPKEELEALDVPKRIEHLKLVIASDEPPERCYEDEEFGKSGNRALKVNCSYCPFKHHCWSDANDGIGLRTFLYSKGPVHFTQVNKEPDVHEVTF